MTIITIGEMALRMGLSLTFALVIGMERSKNHSSAGIKTHTLVAIAATLITLIQVRISQDALVIAQEYTNLAGIVRSDPARLIAQIVSGIGFLGAGTIIVTERNITGLTTAASIWAVAALGMAVGMGYYDTALIAFGSMLMVLFVIKHVVKTESTERIVVKYLKSEQLVNDIYRTFDELEIEYELLKYDVEPFGDELIVTAIYELHSQTPNYIDQTFKAFSKIRGIISLGTTNLKGIVG